MLLIALIFEKLLNLFGYRCKKIETVIAEVDRQILNDYSTEDEIKEIALFLSNRLVSPLFNERIN